MASPGRLMSLTVMVTGLSRVSVSAISSSSARLSSKRRATVISLTDPPRRAR